MHGALFSRSFPAPRPESFDSVIEVLRDAATVLALDERLGGDIMKSISEMDKKKIIDR